MAPIPRPTPFTGSLNVFQRERRRREKRGGSPEETGPPTDVFSQERGRRRQGAEDPSTQLEDDPGLEIPLPQAPISQMGDEPSPEIARLRSVIGPKAVAPTPEPRIAEDPVVISGAKRGILFDAPMERGHDMAGFAFKQKDRLRAFEIANTDNTGVRAPPIVKVDPETKKLVYFNEERAAWAWVTPPGHSGVKGAQEMIGASSVLIPEIVGGVFGAILGKKPLFVNLGASGGAFSGNIFRLLSGKKMGFNEDMSDLDVIKDSAGVAGIAFAGGVAGDRVIAMGRTVINMMRGKIISQKALDSVGLTLEEAFEMTKSINSKISREELRLTLAQATADPELLIRQKYFEASPQYAIVFGEFKEAQQRAFQEYLKVINRGFETRLQDAAAAGREVQNVMKSYTDSALRFNTVEKQRAQEAAREWTRAMKDRNNASFGEPFRRGGREVQEAYREAEAKNVAALNDMMGDKPFIRLPEAREFANKLTKEMDEALFPGQAADIEGFVGKLPGAQQTRVTKRQLKQTITSDDGVRTSELAEGIEGPRGSRARGEFDESVTRGGGEGEGPRVTTRTVEEEVIEREIVAMSKLRDPDAVLTFDQSWRALSYLKRYIRDRSSGQIKDTADVGAAKKMAKLVEKNMTASMENTAMREQYTTLMGWMARENDRLFRGAFGEAMQREGGEFSKYIVADEKVFTDIFFRAGGVSTAKEVVARFGHNPGMMRALRESAVDFYKKEVGLIRQIGKPQRANLEAHNTFMSNYADVLDVYFGKHTRKDFQKFGKLEFVLQQRVAAFAKAEAEIAETTAGQVIGLKDPSKVVDWMMKPEHTAKAVDVMRILEQKQATGGAAPLLRFKLAPDVPLRKTPIKFEDGGRTPDVVRAVREQVKRVMHKNLYAGKFKNGEKVLTGQNLNNFLFGKAGKDTADIAGKELPRKLEKDAMLPVLEAVFGKQYVKDLLVLNRAMIIAERQPPVSLPNQAFWLDTFKGLIRAQVGMFTRGGRILTAIDRIRGRAANSALTRALLDPDALHQMVALRGIDARTKKATTFLGNIGASAFLMESEGTRAAASGAAGAVIDFFASPDKFSGALPPPKRGLPIARNPKVTPLRPAPPTLGIGGG